MHIQEVQETPSSINVRKRHPPRQITVKLLETKDTEKVLKAVQIKLQQISH